MIKGLSFCVGIVVSDSDDPKFLQNSLDSILSQTQTPDQIVVLTNGKLKDALTSRIDRFIEESKVEVALITQSQQKNFGPNLNMLLNFTNCDYFIRQDPDDISLPTRFKLVSDFAFNNMFDVLFTNSINLDCLSPLRLSAPHVYNQNKTLLTNLIRVNPIVHSSVVLNVKSIKGIGGYRDISKYEDYDLWLRAARYKLIFAYLPKKTVIYLNLDTVSKRKGEIRFISESLIALSKIKLSPVSIISILFWTYCRMILSYFPKNFLQLLNSKYRSIPLSKDEVDIYTSYVKKFS
jgi:hypothetical protein